MRRAILLSSLCACLACGNLKITGHARDGHRAYEQGRFEDAVKEYQTVLELDPGQKEMWRYIARAKQDIYTQSIGGEKADATMEEAMHAWEKVKEVFPDTSADAFKEAESQINQILQQSGKSEQGVDYYRKLVDKTPSPGNFMLLGDFLFKNELQFEDAVAVMDEGLGKFPNDKQLLLSKAIYLWLTCYKQKDLPIDIKKEYIQKGMETIELCIAQPGQPEATPYSYRNLLYRQKAEVEPEKKDEYIELAKADVTKFQELWKSSEKAWRDELAAKSGATPPAAATPPPAP